MDHFNVSMMFFGIVITLTAFIWIVAESFRSRDDVKKLEEKKEELVSIITDAEQILDEMNRFSDYIVTQMDLKSTEMAEVLKMIEEKLGNFKRAVSDADYSTRKDTVRYTAKTTEMKKNDDFRAMTGTIAEGFDTVRALRPQNSHSKGAKDNVIPINSRHKEILRMRDTGMNETEIARQLRVGRGEVQLILELNK